MLPDKWHLYCLMYYSRLYEKAVMNLWKDGKILREIHFEIGEECINSTLVDLR